ncbi:MAG: outer membrane protein assembly factor BamD [Thermoanaerobaculia bacterium]
MSRNKIALIVFAVAAVSCSGAKKPDRVTRDLLSLPKEALFEKGNALLEKGKFEDARKYLNFVFESYPNDPVGQKSLLLVADSYFRRGRGQYVEARYRYRDYLSRYPSADNRPFVLYRYALCYDKEHEKVDRDPTNTREALTQYRNLLKEAPDSPYAAQARGRLEALNDLLADHEFDVGYFYFRKGDSAAAFGRFRYTEENYPEYSHRDKLYFHAGQTLHRLGRDAEAETYFAKLRATYPSSPWTARLRKERLVPVDKQAKAR